MKTNSYPIFTIPQSNIRFLEAIWIIGRVRTVIDYLLIVDPRQMESD